MLSRNWTRRASIPAARLPVFVAGDRLAMLQVVSHEYPKFLPGVWALHAVNRCSKGREVAWIREAMDHTVAI